MALFDNPYTDALLELKILKNSFIDVVSMIKDLEDAGIPTNTLETRKKALEGDIYKAASFIEGYLQGVEGMNWGGKTIKDIINER